MDITFRTHVMEIVGCPGGRNLALISKEFFATTVAFELIHCAATFKIVYVAVFGFTLMQVYFCGFFYEHLL